jgi:proteasome lid subunit RPN8/RPN11|tara:strand:+ start:4635 stop:5009 length:375 start_codon:yes stop_codon:yes gene_type:complete
MERFDKLKEEMQLHAEADYPREACGVILKDFTYVRADNLSNTPTLTFELDPGALVKYDEQIWGIFHSHPGSDQPLPSREDKHAAAFVEYKYIVGFGLKYYIYWYDSKLDALKFDKFESKHIGNN